MPWPISTFAMTRRTVPSVSMRMNAFGANAGLPSAAAAAASPGCRRAFMIARAGPAAPNRKNATDRPPPALSTCRRPRLTPLSPGDDFATSFMARLRRSKGERLHDLQLIRRRLFNGRPDAHVSSAAANVSCHCCVDIGVGRIWCVCQQSCCSHDLARLAVAALNHFGLEPGLLDFFADCRRTDGLDRRNRFATYRANRKHTRTNGLPVKMNGARTTLRDAATELRPRQAQDVAQHPQERHVRGDIRGMRLAVDLQGHHRLSPYKNRSGISDVHWGLSASATRRANQFRPTIRLVIYIVKSSPGCRRAG